MAQFQPTRWFLSFIGTGLLLAAMVLAACGEDEPELGGERPDGTIEHPVADSIPHFDRDHVPITREQGIDSMEDPPRSLVALADYLERPEPTDARSIDIFVSDALHFGAVAVGGERLVMLDTRGDQLVEYDVDTGEITRLAEQGRGPGDVQFTEDLARYGTDIYVAMEDRRVSRFNCDAVPCEHDRSIGLDVAAHSVAAVDDATIAVLGHTLHMADDPGDADDNQTPVRIFREEDEPVRAFGAAYGSEVHMIQGAFHRGGIVGHVKTPERYVQSLLRLPFLYVYDDQGRLQSTYEVEPFIYQMVQQTDRGARRQVPDQEWSKIRDVRAVEGAILLVRARTHQNPREVGGEGTEAAPTQWGYDIREDYYAVDISNEESYHVGSHAYEGPPTEALFITDLGLVINEAGELSLIAY